jgi:hypothetical protein
VSVGVNCTVDAVTDPHHSRCHCDIHTLTVANCADSPHCSTENGAITAITDIKAVDCLIYVDVTFFAIQNFDVDSSDKVGVIFDCDTLIQISNVL